MAKYEQFVVKRIGENEFENVHWNVRGTAEEVKKYAEEHDYGAGVVVYRKLAFGSELIPIDVAMRQ